MILSFLFSSIISASAIYQWPQKDWTTALPSEVGINESELERALDYAFPENINWKSRDGIRTEGLLIVKDGLLVYEKYAQGFSHSKPHPTWSVSKMLVNAMTGAAIRQNKIRLSDSVSKYMTVRGKEKELEALKVRDLLYWSSGLDWHETYETNPIRSSVIAMLYGEGQSNMESFILGFPFAKTPGTSFSYSSGDSVLMTAVLKHALEKDFDDFAWKEIFNPLGMKSAVLETDAKGLPVGSSYLYASAPDLAKLGLLYLNDGRWSDKQILPRGWIFESMKVTDAYKQSSADLKHESLSPGLHLWVNIEDPSRKIKRPMPNAPADLFGAHGHWGQNLWIVPSLRMVVVRFADDRDDTFSGNHFWGLLMNAITTPSNLKATKQ